MSDIQQAFEDMIDKHGKVVRALVRDTAPSGGDSLAALMMALLEGACIIGRGMNLDVGLFLALVVRSMQEVGTIALEFEAEQEAAEVLERLMRKVKP